VQAIVLPTTQLAVTTIVAVPVARATTTAARRYVFPIEPAEAARFGQCHHTYPATDIFAAAGSRYIAVTDGIIDFVSAEDLWSAQNDDPEVRGGLSIALVGDDGVRYYGSHLSQIAEGIAPGVRVTTGQILGLTGTSGNARETPPHLHFGISRPTTPDDWEVRRGHIDPYPYLLAWRDGVDVTPDLTATSGILC